MARDRQITRRELILSSSNRKQHVQWELLAAPSPSGVHPSGTHLCANCVQFRGQRSNTISSLFSVDCSSMCGLRIQKLGGIIKDIRKSVGSYCMSRTWGEGISTPWSCRSGSAGSRRLSPENPPSRKRGAPTECCRARTPRAISAAATPATSQRRFPGRNPEMD